MRFLLLLPVLLSATVFAEIAELSTVKPIDNSIVNSTKVDIDTILRAVGAPPCMRQCIDPFMGNLTALWDMEMILEHTAQLCDSHTKALNCLKEAPYCDMRNIFATATSSVHHRCETQSRLFVQVEKCMKGKTDAIVQECDAVCHLRENVTAFSNNPSVQMAGKFGGNVFIVSEHIAPMCRSVSCIIPCLTQKLNIPCPLSGWLTLDVLLQPFEALAGMLDAMGPALRDLIKNKLDPSCHFAIDRSVLTQVRKGNFEVLKKP